MAAIVAREEMGVRQGRARKERRGDREEEEESAMRGSR